MPIPNAELLDIIRKLRTYTATLDNVHNVLRTTKESDDQQIVDMATELLNITPQIATKTAMLLRKIESSKSYREIVKTFNIKE